MSFRSLVAGGAAPSFTIPNPTSGDIGSALVVGDGAACSWGVPDGAGKYYSGTLAFAAVGPATGTFAAGAYTAVVTPSSVQGYKLVTLRFEGATTDVVLGGGPQTITVEVPADLNAGPGTVVAGMVILNDPAAVRISAAKISGTTLTISRVDGGGTGGTFTNGAATIQGFVATWLTTPPP